MTMAWLAAIVFFAAILQALTGFGFALVVMPLATLVLDLQTAAPLIALTALTANIINVIRFRRAVDWSEVARLALGSALGIPAGMWALVHVDELTISRIVGAILCAYAAYTLLPPSPTQSGAGRPAAPGRLAEGWAYPAGFLAGCLGGAYSTPGPPVVVYGSLRQWPKDEDRAIVQTFFFVNGLLVVSSHLLAQRVVARVWTLYAWTAPLLLLGLWAGTRLDRYVDQTRFRALVTAMILALGLSMLLGLGRR